MKAAGGRFKANSICPRQREMSGARRSGALHLNLQCMCSAAINGKFYVVNIKTTFLLCVIEFAFSSPPEPPERCSCRLRREKLAAKCIEINEISKP